MWVYGSAWVFDQARVYVSARVFGSAQVYGSAQVFGSAVVFDSAVVSGKAWVYGEAQVFDSAQVFGLAWVYGEAWVYGSARVYGTAVIRGLAAVSGISFVQSPKDLAQGTFHGYPWTICRARDQGLAHFYDPINIPSEYINLMEKIHFPENSGVLGPSPEVARVLEALAKHPAIKEELSELLLLEHIRGIQAL